ncbi:hypothetical protein D9M70_594810 [compost metagenome]
MRLAKERRTTAGAVTNVVTPMTRTIGSRKQRMSSAIIGTTSVQVVVPSRSRAMSTLMLICTSSGPSSRREATVEVMI